MANRIPTTKDIGLLQQLHQQGQLRLAAEFQRNSVWPKPAKAYLIDTILNGRPMPIFFFQRGRSAQTGRLTYTVIDGQQRLRAIFEFLDDRFRLSQSKGNPYFNKRFSQLSPALKDAILDYDINVEELTGYREEDIRDIFVRMNKYVVKLSRQEMRHAQTEGVFHDFVEEIGAWEFWRENRVFTQTQLNRMRAVEFAAELTILVIEGPQDKKAVVDLYYGQYRNSFAAARAVRSGLRKYLDWIA